MNNNAPLNFEYNNMNVNDLLSQLSVAQEEINILRKENSSLKLIISNKDKIIADFENISIQSKEKFEKLEKINFDLKNELNILKEKEGSNQLLQNDNYNLKQKLNKKKEENKNLINSIKTIKYDLEYIEADFNTKMNEKDNNIEQLNNEIIYIYNEYKKISDVLEKLKNMISNCNYSKLQTEFNCLLREKEILLKEKEQDHKEIIDLRKKYLNHQNKSDNQ